MSKNKNIILNVNNNESKIDYIGYYKMLDKILDLMDKCSCDNKFILIDKYIELVKEINKGDSNE